MNPVIRPVTRETSIDMGDGKVLMVTLNPDGTLTLWPKGTQQKRDVNLKKLYESELAIPIAKKTRNRVPKNLDQEIKPGVKIPGLPAIPPLID